MYSTNMVASLAIPGMEYTQRRTSAVVARGMGIPQNRREHHILCESTTALAATMDAVAIPHYRQRDVISRGTSGTDSDTLASAKGKIATGDLGWASRSDKHLERFDSLVVARTAWKVVDAMEGGVPNVPAMLAGHPIHMRRRNRVVRESAPVSILVDVATSAGVDKETIAKRGALVLALVRILQARRPVNLYVTAGLSAGADGREDEQDDASFITCRIDTAPLDLARAGYMLGSADWRYWGFATAHAVGFDPTTQWGTWPFGKGTAHRPYMREIFAGILPESDLLIVNSMHLKDSDLKDPGAWLDRMLAEYGNLDEEAA
jgi:hypothetical protein